MKVSEKVAELDAYGIFRELILPLEKGELEISYLLRRSSMTGETFGQWISYGLARADDYFKGIRHKRLELETDNYFVNVISDARLCTEIADSILGAEASS